MDFPTPPATVKTSRLRLNSKNQPKSSHDRTSPFLQIARKIVNARDGMERTCPFKEPPKSVAGAHTPTTAGESLDAEADGRLSKRSNDDLSEQFFKKRKLKAVPSAPALPWVGLANLGNSCYINALLQVLFAAPGMLPTLAKVALAFDQQDACVPAAAIGNGEQHGNVSQKEDGAAGTSATGAVRRAPPMVVRALARLGRAVPLHVLRWKQPQLETDNDGAVSPLVVSPDELVSLVRKQFGQHQQDVQELSHFLFNQIDDAGQACRDSPVADGLNTAMGIFAGELLSTLKCLSCEKTSSCKESFLDISVALDPEEHVSLCNVLDGFTKPEHLRADNKYKCDGCHSQTEAIRFLRISKLPRVLTFHFKRFAVSRSPGFVKVSAGVPFPTTLRMNKWCTPEWDTDDVIYTLFAVVCHTGATASSGHYMAFVRPSAADIRGWLRCDDDKLTLVPMADMANILHQRRRESLAYMLYYSRT